MLKWRTRESDWKAGKAKSRYLGVSAKDPKRSTTVWRIQYKKKITPFRTEEAARDAYDSVIVREDAKEGKGMPMTNARFWVDDPALRDQHWAERTAALSEYYERQLAAGWPWTGKSAPVCSSEPSMY